MWHVWLFSFCPLSACPPFSLCKIGPAQGFFLFKRSFSCQCWLFWVRAWVSVTHMIKATFTWTDYLFHYWLIMEKGKFPHSRMYTTTYWKSLEMFYWSIKEQKQIFTVTVPQDWSVWGNGSAGSVFPFKFKFLLSVLSYFHLSCVCFHLRWLRACSSFVVWFLLMLFCVHVQSIRVYISFYYCYDKSKWFRCSLGLV